MNIQEGWCLYVADFSIQAVSNPSEKGRVALVRAPIDRVQWHKQPDVVKDSEECPPLYVYGSGMTLEEAVTNANLAAAHAKPIVEGTS